MKNFIISAILLSMLSSCTADDIGCVENTMEKTEDVAKESVSLQAIRFL